MNLREKALKLYQECGTDPNSHTLMPIRYFADELESSYLSMVVAAVINAYITEDFENDLVPFERERFYVPVNDNEGWEIAKGALKTCVELGILEEVKTDSGHFVRLISDDFFDPELYKRNQPQ